MQQDLLLKMTQEREFGVGQENVPKALPKRNPPIIQPKQDWPNLEEDLDAVPIRV